MAKSGVALWVTPSKALAFSPHLTLIENLTIIARKEGMSQKNIAQRTKELCELMNLPTTSAFLNKKPREISGGQQQRVGIARALFMKPKIMLMDEPFSALDPITRSELQKEFLNLQSKLKLTIVLVTHDLQEAFGMSNEIVLLNQGSLEQKGQPSKFLLAPATNYVKEFMESHSPGNILKEVYLYAVMNTSLYSSFKTQDTYTLKHLDSLETYEFSSIEQASDFLRTQEQMAHYWVDENDVFIEQTNDKEHSSKTSITSTSHILSGMKALLETQNSSLPVVSESGQLKGVFSEEALDAL